MRALILLVRGVVLALLCVAPVSAANPLVGNWASTVNWHNQASGLSEVMQLGANGSIHLRVMNHKGTAFDMFGTYKMDATGKMMRFSWTSYAPEQLCSISVGCTPLRPPLPLGVAHTSRIQFQNANAFTGIASGGSSMIWLRGR